MWRLFRMSLVIVMDMMNDGDQHIVAHFKQVRTWQQNEYQQLNSNN